MPALVGLASMVAVQLELTSDWPPPIEGPNAALSQIEIQRQRQFVTCPRRVALTAAFGLFERPTRLTTSKTYWCRKYLANIFFSAWKWLGAILASLRKPVTEGDVRYGFRIVVEPFVLGEVRPWRNKTVSLQNASRPALAS